MRPADPGTRPRVSPAATPAMKRANGVSSYHGEIAVTVPIEGGAPFDVAQTNVCRHNSRSWRPRVTAGSGTIRSSYRG